MATHKYKRQSRKSRKTSRKSRKTSRKSRRNRRAGFFSKDSMKSMSDMYNKGKASATEQYNKGKASANANMVKAQNKGMQMYSQGKQMGVNSAKKMGKSTGVPGASTMSGMMAKSYMKTADAGVKGANVAMNKMMPSTSTSTSTVQQSKGGRKSRRRNRSSSRSRR